ncbi:aminopeptidase C [Mycoplasma sp. 4F]|uniref:aminopeptidase C n=1 Tax=Mycoplasma sp. 4F TaxID=3401664 RepID=UPI003AADEB4A
MELKLETLNKFAQRFDAKENNKLIQNAVIKNGIKNTCINHEVLIKHNFVFDIETTLGDITSQNSSGRCWIFASLNMARVAAMKNLNVKTFEFSQNYFAFYDKLEKANTFLNLAIENIDKDANDRLIYHLIAHSTATDGGYWEWFASLLRKYGAVPKNIMPETFLSGNTNEMNEQIDLHLKQAYNTLKQMHKQGKSLQAMHEYREDVLFEVYDIVAKCLGRPPKVFTYEYKDKDDKYQKVQNVTPKEFFDRFVGTDFDNKVDLIHDPRDLYPTGTKYILKYQNSIYQDSEVAMVNASLNVIKEAVIASLKDNVPVWFGCDIDPFKDNKSGVLDPELYLYDELFTPVNNLNKAARVDLFNSSLNHAMAFVGVKTNEGKPVAWKVENSWGDKSGNKGVYSMSDSWFDEYNFSVIVDRKYVAEALLKETNPKVYLELWEPLA